MILKVKPKKLLFLIMNHTDICELNDERSIIFCLKERFRKQNIYTYVAKVLIAINPYRNINGLYCEEKIRSYREDFNDELPPHLYALANRIIRRISPERSQSIILTGESGSGKTRSAAHMLTFLGQSSLSHQIKRHISATNSIFELFGNAKTCLNGNSSRFSKLTEMYFHPDLRLASVRFTYLLLESSRVYARNENETNFHIFYSLSSATGDLRKQLGLNIAKNYAYLSGYNHLNNSIRFEELDDNLASFGISSEERTQAYEILAAILHLGNTIIEEDPSDGKCRISHLSLGHFQQVARLLKIDQQKLETSLLTRSIEVIGSNPSSKAITIDLNLSRANKLKQTLSKILFERVFDYVVSLVNDISLNNSSSLHLKMLDIAGFESFGASNRFEQLCINYVNEKVQQMFVKLMLKDEQDWYVQECLEIPTIPFLDNGLILDAFENKSRGIFQILDDTCKMQCQTSKHFVENVLASWSNNSIIMTPNPKEIQQNHLMGFVIRHFVGNVLYNADNFLEKNLDVVPKSIDDICKNIDFLSNIQNGSVLHGKSATFTLKMAINELTNKLKKTECSFIRCIKPNEKQSPELFDECLVSSQLVSSGCIAYQKLMRTGYPSHMNIDDLLNQLNLNLEFSQYASKYQKEFCGILLRSCGLKWKDFRLGNKNVFFRNGKMDKLIEKLKGDLEVITNRCKELKLMRAKWRIMLIATRFYSIVKKWIVSTSNKRRKLDDGPSSTLNATPIQKKVVVEQRHCQKTVHSRTITIPSNENRTPETMNTENQLRKLLRQERENNEKLNLEYRKLQEKNLNLVASCNELKKENQRLESLLKDCLYDVNLDDE